MDFSNLRISKDAVPVQLKHPETGEPLIDPKTEQPVNIYLHGTDSPIYKQIKRRSLDETFKRARGKPIELTAEQIESRARETLLACGTGWDNIELDGKPLEFSRENTIRLFDECNWVEEQVDAAIANRANFMRTSSTD